MYAVIKTGGKQYPVRVGDKLKIATLEHETRARALARTEPGESLAAISPAIDATVKFDQVLLRETNGTVVIGHPFVDGALVQAKVIGHGRADKVKIIKFRRRKHHMKQMGHRQNFTEVEITSIN